LTTENNTSGRIVDNTPASLIKPNNRWLIILIEHETKHSRFSVISSFCH